MKLSMLYEKGREIRKYAALSMAVAAMCITSFLCTEADAAAASSGTTATGQFTTDTYQSFAMDRNNYASKGTGSTDPARIQCSFNGYNNTGIVVMLKTYTGKDPATDQVATKTISFSYWEGKNNVEKKAEYMISNPGGLRYYICGKQPGPVPVPTKVYYTITP